jgi:hypothetical protein
MASVGSPLITIQIESYNPEEGGCPECGFGDSGSFNYGVHVETQHLPMPQHICERCCPKNFNLLEDVADRVAELARTLVMEYEGVPVHINRSNF